MPRLKPLPAGHAEVIMYKNGFQRKKFTVRSYNAEVIADITGQYANEPEQDQEVTPAKARRPLVSYITWPIKRFIAARLNAVAAFLSRPALFIYRIAENIQPRQTV